MDHVTFHPELFIMATDQQTLLSCGPEQQESWHQRTLTAQGSADKLDKPNMN